MYTQLEQRGMAEPPVNVATLRKMKDEGTAIACVTAYDASFAQLVDLAAMDLVLVGDSLGMVIQGHDTTVPVTWSATCIPGVGHAVHELHRSLAGSR
jgi:3-methyl-2-oxobutanoate hydroxymethyltransferase